MSGYILRRLLGLIPVLFGVSLLVFGFVRMIPGDPAVVLLGERATPEALEQLRQQLALDKPIFFDFSALGEGRPSEFFDSQYITFVSRAMQGDLGQSIFSRVDVVDELWARFPATLELSIFAMLIALVLGIPAGILAATQRGRAGDFAVTTLALFGVSMPIFWLGMLLIYLFAVNLGWLPPSGRLDVNLRVEAWSGLYVLDGLLRGQPEVSLNALAHLVLPALALGTIPLAVITRITRGAMLEVLNQDYIRTARAKGLAPRRVLWSHALKNAMLPVITIVGLQFGVLLTGAILTETIFNWPGIGKWIYDAISARDYPIIQAGTLFIATVYVLINLLVDISYAWFDPRIEYR